MLGVFQDVFDARRGQVHIVTGPAGQRVKINALTFEAGVLVNLPAVTTAAGQPLLFIVAHWITRDMHGVAGGAINRALIVRAAGKPDHVGPRSLFGVASHADAELLVPR
jgi:hypothetical protein